MNTKPYLFISSWIFGLVAALHLVRVLTGIDIRIGPIQCPVGLSWCGLLAATVLSVWGFRLARH